MTTDLPNQRNVYCASQNFYLRVETDSVSESGVVLKSSHTYLELINTSQTLTSGKGIRCERKTI